MSPANLPSIELFWRAANYLTVGQLYLKANPLLRDPLRPEHFKQSILGHWGTCPAISAVYAHISDLSRRTGQRMRLIVGTGHAAPAILSCLYLEGNLAAVYPQFTRDLTGLVSLFNAFASSDGFSTEMTAAYPGALYAGGELGAALAFSQGYAFSNPTSFSICVVGDGELETSLTQASWQGFKFLSSTNDGKLLPVINANGYKMGSESLYALQSREDHALLYRGYGFNPMFVGPNHREIAEACDAAYTQLTSSNAALRPIIILESPKGWTAPRRLGQHPFAGTCGSHKPILRHPSADPREAEMIGAWLLSYRPDELFDASGAPVREITACLPPARAFLGTSHQFDQDPSSLVHPPTVKCRSSIEAVSLTLSDIIRELGDILIFSPDELTSNRLGNILQITSLKYGNVTDLAHASTGQVIEVLNEHLCYAWSQGYSSAGHRAVIVSYEAFAPMFDSMVAQHLKFLHGCTNTQWRPAYPSISIILTSLGWNNIATHHNPGFVDTLLGRGLPNVRVYMPVTALATAYFLQEMIGSYNRVNVMVLSKHELHRLSSISSAIDQGIGASWRELQDDPPRASRISLIALGDWMAEESLYAKDIINSRCPDASVRVVAVENVSCLERSGHSEREAFLSAIADSCCVWAYNGYPKTIQALIWGVGVTAKTTVLGYRDHDQAGAGLGRFSENGVSRFEIADEAARLLSKDIGSVTLKGGT